MPRKPLLALAATVVVVAGLASTNPTFATSQLDYCGGQCSDVLPPGENGNATLADILANQSVGTRPGHTDDQLSEYASLASNYKNLTNATLGKFFNDASFGVPSANVEKTYQPRADVTIVRDNYGIPHITGTTRSGTEYGAGYAAAEDRLWMMDVFRHVGRGELSSFAGGATGNRALEQSFWAVAPYTEADLQAQVDRIAASGTRGALAKQDMTDYLSGINSYVTAAKGNRTFPGEYVLTGKIDSVTNVGTIDPFTATDLIAIAGVIGALFGSGGGGEVQAALVLQAAQAKYGVNKGIQVYDAFREENDPEAVKTLHDGQSFPYSASPANPVGVAMPDTGSVTAAQLVYDPTGTATTTSTAKSVLPGDLLSKKHGMSNALVVSGQYTDTGNPIAVFGPQTGYFAPQLLMLQEIQGPGISARGASFAGVSMYVELGRGQDYAWSATSASQDVSDTFAVELCDPNGNAVTKDANYYLYHGTCTAMEKMERDNSWSPTTADSTAEGSYKLVVYRTNYGLVQYRATIGGKPYAYALSRDSYGHEAESVIGFQEFNDPSFVSSAATFQQAAADVNYTFNWFYVDSKHTAYYNSGFNPVRAANTDPNLPILGTQQYEWADWNPSTWTTTYADPSTHPQDVDQDYYISWNNKQADGTTTGFGTGSVHRGDLLNVRVKALISSGTKVTRASLTQAMADAAVTDLRTEDILPELIKVIDTATITDSATQTAVTALKIWLANGGKRVEASLGSKAYVDTSAIQTMDAWWPLLVKAIFQSGMGTDLYAALAQALQINESPSGGQNGDITNTDVNESQPHKGSSFQYGWWSYVDKDIRAVLGQSVQGGLVNTFCGTGTVSSCRDVLLSSLKTAAAESASTVYPGDANCSEGDQWCADSIIQRPLGGITDNKITWQNRPTYQQVVQFPSHR